MSHAGWSPKGRKTEDGIIPSKYYLNEMTSADYLPRTKINVFDLDATVIFIYGPLIGGSLQIATYAHHLKKPFHNVDLLLTSRKRAVENIVRWLDGNAELTDYDEYIAKPPLECVLNVAGSRESKAPGIQDAVWRIMVDVLIQVNPDCMRFYRLVEPKIVIV